MPATDTRLDRRVGLWQAHDARRAPAQASTSTRKDPARTRPGAREAREPGEETGAGNQKEREEWTDGTFADTGQGPCADEKVGCSMLAVLALE